MMRAVLTGGGVALIGAFLGFLYFVSAGGPTASGQMSSDEAFLVGLVALGGGVASLFFAFGRFEPTPSWLATIAGWIVGFHMFPPILMGMALMLMSIAR